MQILLNIFHPDLTKSNVNSRLLSGLDISNGSITKNLIYDKYQNFQIDIPQEQILLESHDKIIFQFPLYWYSCPSLMKKYIDDVLAFGWAYGSDVDRLSQKTLSLVVTAGGSRESYSKNGTNGFAVEDFLIPFMQTANFLNMNYSKPFIIYNASNILNDEWNEINIDYQNYILS
jgi:glutathione-regulated potassium-efflux system ancillary protein KefG